MAFVLSTTIVHQSYRAIATKAMSERLKRMQRDFLRQLIYQASIPYAMVVVPISYAYLKVYMMSFDYYCKLNKLLRIISSP